MQIKFLLQCVVASVQLVAFVAADLRGDLSQTGVTAYLPGDSQFSGAARAFNTRFTFTPAAIAYPQTAQDVSKVVKVAVANGLSVSARSGGHSYVANGLGGQSGHLVVDMSKMKAINIDQGSKIATIETGNRLGDVAKTLNAAGRALPHGTCPYVGIGGHSAYGGFGFTSRLWGLTLDTVQAVNAVLANGTIVRATASSQSDIFWAFRGAGPSFGIVTSIETSTFALPASSLLFSYEWNSLDAQRASAALQVFQSYPQQNSLAAELGLEIVLGSGGGGTLSFTIQGGYYGSDGRAGIQRLMTPFISAMNLPGTSLNVQGDGTYIDTVRILAEEDGGLDMDGPDMTDTFYARSIIVPENEVLSKQASDSFMNYLATHGSNIPGINTNADTGYWFIEIELFGGKNSKINSVPADSTSFARRDGLLTMQVYASSGDRMPFPTGGYTFIDGVINSMVSTMPSSWNYGAYANYIEDRLSNWQQRYFGDHYQQLVSIKRQVDPGNVFKFPFGVEV
ncbi:FAD-binding domain-containing protein [Marasmius fiardii PR-910]|nr:FAD-binding domain-containing protein [Marasmius fiardii PR-910]